MPKSDKTPSSRRNGVTGHVCGKTIINDMVAIATECLKF
jgi:hypothetical protein